MAQLNKSRAVKWSRYLIFICLIIMTAAITTMTYVTLKQQDQQLFEQGVSSNSTMDNVQWTMYNVGVLLSCLLAHSTHLLTTFCVSSAVSKAQ